MGYASLASELQEVKNAAEALQAEMTTLEATTTPTPENDTGNTMPPDKTAAEWENRHYKLFYGEWEVTELIERGPGPNMYGHPIGQRVYYDKGTFCSNGKEVPGKCVYRITMLPVTDISYEDYKMSPSDLGLKGDYFAYVYVEVEPIMFSMDEEPLCGQFFYVKDDETLIVSYDNNYYEMKRVSHINNYDVYYVSP